jgi:hypothetical protein
MARIVVVALIGAAFASASPAAATYPTAATAASQHATRATFAGTWIGHTRHLVISRKGRASEHIDDGCCHQVIDLKLRLSHARGSARRASIRARVTSVHVRDSSYFTKKRPAPHVGQKRRLRLRNGVIHERLTRTTYCNSAAAAKGICGA